MSDEARRANRRANRLTEQVAAVAGRLTQVESNTARIARLEAQMAEVLDALPKIKGL